MLFRVSLKHFRVFLSEKYSKDKLSSHRSFMESRQNIIYIHGQSVVLVKEEGIITNEREFEELERLLGG